MVQRGGRRVPGFGLGEALQLVKGVRYAGTLNLSWTESALATDALVAEKFTSAGFTNVMVDMPNKHVEGTWSRNDQTVVLPDQITSVHRLDTPPPAISSPESSTSPSEPTPTTTVRQPVSFTRETPLPMTESQRGAAIDAWAVSSGFARITLPDGASGFKGTNGDLLQANGMPYVPPAPFSLSEWILEHQTPLAIVTAVVGSVVIYKLVAPVVYVPHTS